MALTFNTSKLRKSVLLSVPLYFYTEFIKMNYKALITVVVITVAYYKGYTKLPYLDHPSIQDVQNMESSQSTEIQSPNQLQYAQIVREFRYMQQATLQLLLRQQAAERKNAVMQQQITKLKLATLGKAGILNEAQAESMIKEALTIYDADKLGLRDYALESLGGRIVSTPKTVARLTQTVYTFFGLFSFQSYSNPRTLIQAYVQPGKCFTFEGSQGQIRIKLSHVIYISAVTMEHAPISLLTAEEISSAPKQFEVIGLENEDSEERFSLGTFTYSTTGLARQTFLVDTSNEKIPFQFVELYILNNHGNDDFTCVYRIRVHGRQL